MLIALSYLASFVFFGTLGGLVAKADRWPVIWGVLIGGFFSFIGLAFLVGVWLAEDFVNVIGGRKA